MFEVMQKRCDRCLFGPDPIVTPERRRDIIHSLTEEENHFVCHHATIARGEGDRPGVCCRADYDRNPARTNLMRIAGRLGAVRFISEQDLKEGKRSA